jgi:ketosteroid isomerase-like protein
MNVILSGTGSFAKRTSLRSRKLALSEAEGDPTSAGIADAVSGDSSRVVVKAKAIMLNTGQRIFSVLSLLLLLTCSTLSQTQSTPKPKKPPSTTEDFATTIQKLRETWVQEFNAGHAEKVAAFYAPEAVLMRWDGSVHGYDSILAEMQRSITGGAHGYVVHSLHAERSGDLGYDTGAYNVNLRDRVVEGNYLIVVKRIAGQWKIVAHASVPNPRER